MNAQDIIKYDHIESDNINNKIRVSMLDHTLGTLKKGHLLQILLAAILISVLYSPTQSDYLLIWGVVLLAYVILSYILIYLPYQPACIDDENYSHWYWRLSFHQLLLGVLWSFFPLIAFKGANHIETLIMLLSICGTTLGASSTTVGHWPSFIFWSLPISIMIIVLLLLDQNATADVMALLTAICVIAATIFAYSNRKMLRKVLQLTFENEWLAERYNEKRQVAEKANQDKSLFLAAASHDLRQPLHAQRLLLEVLTHRLSDSEHKSIAGKVQQCTQSLSYLLDSLLDISRLDSGDTPVDIQTINLQSIINTIIYETGVRATEKNIALISIPTSVLVKGDKPMLTRMLRNLLDNAIHYTREGRITVGVRRLKNHARLEIWDTGIGIDSNKLENIFSEFYQINNPERDLKKGLGLGLSIVKRLAELQNFSVTVDSWLNRGTVFKITMPLAGQHHTISQAIKPEESSNHSRLKILVIENDQMVLTSLNLLLDSWGHDTRSAQCTASSLSAITNFTPDLIIADYHLSNGETGLQAIAAVSSKISQITNTIIISGDTSEDVANAVMKQNIPLLRKPIDPRQLHQVLATIGLSN